MSFRFLHAADIHLDSPLKGLSARDPDLASVFAGASRAAFSNLVTFAIDEKVAFVVVSGDLYDGDWEDYQTGHAFLREAGRLARAGIRLLLIRGNHDAESVISRTLPLPDGVRLLATRAETVELPEFRAAIHGMSFADRQATENIVQTYPAARPSWFNLGLLHTSLNGREGHDSYAPCALSDLLRLDYGYWALGHIHKREVVSEETPVVFPGNLQARSVRETGPKGATLVTVSDGRVAAFRHVALDAARWARVAVDLSEAADPDALDGLVREALEAAEADADRRPLAVRLVLQGATAADRSLRALSAEALRGRLQALASAVGPALMLERIAVETRPPGRNDEAAGGLGELSRFLDEAATDPRFRERLKGLLAPIDRRAPSHPDLDPDAADGEAAALDRLIEAARALVRSRAGGGAGEADGDERAA